MPPFAELTVDGAASSRELVFSEHLASEPALVHRQHADAERVGASCQRASGVSELRAASCELREVRLRRASGERAGAS
ncbi:MAG: hypothetical protein K0R38_6759 [Polyangiaceae bacterium]|nr:hypothetical protein [Polyangiaceae bacterium]